MGRPLRFILALPMIALVVMHPGRIESRPMPGNQTPRAGRSTPAPVEVRSTGSGEGARLRRAGESNPSPATLPCAVPCAALPDKPEPRLAEEPNPPGGFLRKPEPKFGTRRSKRAWLLLAIAQHSAAGFDAYSTRRAVDEGHRELDPLMHPFAYSPAIYPAMQVGPALLDLLGYRMMTSRRRWARRIWWLPQAVAIAGFIWAGTRNLNLPSLRKR